MKKFIGLLFASVLFNVALSQELVSGFVYLDENQNGQRDRKEKGLSDVQVSNGIDVVTTDQSGRYELPLQEDNIIFVIKPAGYAFPLDETNHPKFYHIHKPKGSPVLKFAGVAPTGKLPKSLDFPLHKVEESDTFSAFIFGDPQAYNLDELDYFARGIVNEAKERKEPVFGISLGDLVGDDLSLHPAYKKVIGEVGVPWYNVIGNHDLNFDVVNDSLADESFERVFGPANYSFNVGNAHFMILDNIIYPHPTTGKGYQGGFREDQLLFIENNLKHVDKNKLIVLAFHIPLNPNNGSSFRIEDRKRLFELLKDFPNTLSMSAHTHYQQQIFYNNQHDWHGSKPHHEYNVGTTSGDWYSGKLNGVGVPVSTMRDGTPKGYALLKVKGNTYNFDYKVAGEDDSYGIHVFGPAVVSSKNSRRYSLYANFFIGAENDVVRYRINDSEWKNMERVEIADPQYTKDVLEFDGASAFIAGKRPSDPVKSTHLWKLKLPKLEEGKQRISIEAVDMFGRTHTTVKVIDVVK